MRGVGWAVSGDCDEERTAKGEWKARIGWAVCGRAVAVREAVGRERARVCLVSARNVEDMAVTTVAS